MEVTIGGNRVGSGSKMKTHINNYNRSTHNLSEKFASSMASGILYPCLCKVGMRGDSFDIKINGDVRTLPTKGPLFGSYKMQIDIYQCPVRLYQGILHNNPLAIGLKMDQVKFPRISLSAKMESSRDWQAGKFNESCLMKYLGMSGIGCNTNTSSADTLKVGRQVNALPLLSYYDIFKTYYANKQEGKGYVITGEADEISPNVQNATYNGMPIEVNTDNWTNKENGNQIIDIFGYNLSLERILIVANNQNEQEIFDNTLKGLNNNGYISIITNSNERITIQFTGVTIIDQQLDNFKIYTEDEQVFKTSVIKDFNLSNIDDMRYYLLSQHTLGTPAIIGGTHYILNRIGKPYDILWDDENAPNRNPNKYPLNGLVLKTYQNDIFNNWLNSEWIEGENSINELTKVAIVDGKFSMDALNFAQKQYNMLNRIAVAGATYEDWQDVVYEEVKRRQIESPIYVGGMSQEIMFDEVIQTAGGEDPLGTLGGRGRAVGETRKGGKLHIKCDEACFIIGIVSLTPRIFYTQGNEFYMTELDSMNDLHKPAMDGIGFQDLIGERVAWWDTHFDMSNSGAMSRSKIGKLPAWIEYMTSYDRAYGDFAKEYGVGYMILNRNYERDSSTGGIKDATTYVDPSKYNYAFAYTALDAQNFWCEIGFNIEARRLMSARLIPSV